MECRRIVKEIADDHRTRASPLLKYCASAPDGAAVLEKPWAGGTGSAGDSRGERLADLATRLRSASLRFSFRRGGGIGHNRRDRFPHWHWRNPPRRRPCGPPRLSETKLPNRRRRHSSNINMRHVRVPYAGSSLFPLGQPAVPALKGSLFLPWFQYSG